MRANYILFIVSVFVISRFYSLQIEKKEAFYLIDEKKIAGLSKEDRELLDSCLSVYHNSDDEKNRYFALETISESIDDKLVKPYRMTLESLLHGLLKKGNIKGLPGIKKSISNVQWRLGNDFYDEGKHELALEHFYHSLKLCMEVENDTGIVMNLYLIGRLKIDRGEILKGLKYLEMCEKRSKQIGLTDMEINSLNVLGNIYQEQSDFTKASKYFEKGLVLSKEINDGDQMATISSNLGVMYLRQGEPTEAINYFNDGLEKFLEENHEYGVVYSLLNIGTCYSEMNNSKLALKHLSEGLQISYKLEDNALISKFLTKKGVVLMHDNELDSAGVFLKEGFRLAQEVGSPRLIRHTSKYMVSYYEKIGEKEKAYDMYKVYIEMRDSLNVQEELKKIERRKNNEELKLKQQQIVLLNTDKELKSVQLRLSLLFYLVILLVVIFIASFLLRQRKNKYENELKKLRSFNKELEAKTTKKKINSLPIMLGKKIVAMDLNEVVYFSTEGRYVFLTNKEGKSFLVDQTIGSLESLLPNSFFRIHRAIIINAEEIGEIEKADRGKVLFTMKGNKTTTFRSSLGYNENVKEVVDSFKNSKS